MERPITISYGKTLDTLSRNSGRQLGNPQRNQPFFIPNQGWKNQHQKPSAGEPILHGYRSRRYPRTVHPVLLPLIATRSASMMITLAKFWLASRHPDKENTIVVYLSDHGANHLVRHKQMPTEGGLRALRAYGT